MQQPLSELSVPPSDMANDAGYRDDVTLENGLRVRFRPVVPADRGKLAAGFERLSANSRYRRFFTPKKTLSPAELQFFTEPDGEDHIAIGAVELDEAGREGEGLGIGHLLRLPGDRDVAEITLAVVDSRQGLGIGRRLLQRLLAAAAQHGIRCIRVHLLADNIRMRRLIEQVFGETAFTRDGEMMTGEFPVPRTADPRHVPQDAAIAPLFKLLHLAAEGSLLPVMLGLKGMRQEWRFAPRDDAQAKQNNHGR